MNDYSQNIIKLSKKNSKRLKKILDDKLKYQVKFIYPDNTGKYTRGK